MKFAWLLIRAILSTNEWTDVSDERVRSLPVFYSSTTKSSPKIGFER